MEGMEGLLWETGGESLEFRRQADQKRDLGTRRDKGERKRRNRFLSELDAPVGDG